jgi:hypothetical protein
MGAAVQSDMSSLFPNDHATNHPLFTKTNLFAANIQLKPMLEGHEAMGEGQELRKIAVQWCKPFFVSLTEFLTFHHHRNLDFFTNN